eukprot:32092-Pelagomonas_calceolata.AAC.4
MSKLLHLSKPLLAHSHPNPCSKSHSVPPNAERDEQVSSIGSVMPSASFPHLQSERVLFFRGLRMKIVRWSVSCFLIPNPCDPFDLLLSSMDGCPVTGGWVFFSEPVAAAQGGAAHDCSIVMYHNA